MTDLPDLTDYNLLNAAHWNSQETHNLLYLQTITVGKEDFNTHTHTHINTVQIFRSEKKGKKGSS